MKIHFNRASPLRFVTFIVITLSSQTVFAACADESLAIRKQVDNWSGNGAILKQQYENATALLKRDKNCAPALSQMARIIRKAGYISGDKYHPESLTKARQIAEQAVATQPDCHICSYDLGYVYLFQKDAAAFNALLKDIGSKEKNSLDHAYSLSMEANFNTVVTKDYAKAIQIAESVTGETDEFIRSDLLGIRKRGYRGLKQYDKVDAIFQEQIKLDPSAWLYGDYAEFLTNVRKQHDKAIEYARKSLSMMDYPIGHAKLSTALANKAHELIKAGDLYGAIPLNEEAFKENKRNTIASNNLGYTYRVMAQNSAQSWEQHLDFKNQAIEWYKRTLEVDSRNDYAQRELDQIKRWKTQSN